MTACPDKIKNRGVKKMILRFQTKNDRNGNKKQIEFNTESDTIKTGYFLFIDPDAVTVSEKDYKKLRDNFLKNGLWVQPN